MSQVFDLPSTPIEDGVTLIEASAGTGKTYCLTGLILRMLLEKRVHDVSDLLVVTFTHAATQELVDRIRTALRDACALLAGEVTSTDPFLRHLEQKYRGDAERLALLREALVRFDDLTVSTIHGFCKRVLDDSPFESGMPFQAELLENDAPMLLEAARDVWRRLIYPSTQMVGTVATEENWSPETFLSDYATWHRHPRTTILPQPMSLDAAAAHLDKAYAALQQTWHLGSLLKKLTGRRFLAHSFFSRGPLEDALLDAEAFCRSGSSAGMRAIQELAAPKLEASLFKRDLPGALDHPTIRAATVFAEATDQLRHALRCRFIADVDEQFDRQKQDALVLTYDDLLRRVREALADPGRGDALRHRVRQQYRAALIDEFQDTDLVQYDIFRRLFHHGPLFLIGDPKQAIYRFRGADVFAYLAAKDEADRSYTLDRNWRTAAPLVEAINAIFDRAPRPFVFDRIDFEPATAAREAEPGASTSAGPSRPLQWIWIPRYRNRDESRATMIQAVTAEVRRVLASKPAAGARRMRPDDVAILVRTNDEAREFQESLRGVGVPSVVGRSGDIFWTEEMAELGRLLTAIADPGYAPRLRAAWATRLWGDNAADILEINRDDEAFARRLELFDSYRDDWRRRGLMPMIQRLFGNRQVRQRLLASVAGERRLTNLIQAVDILHQAERERRLSPAALLSWLAAERARDRVETELTELRLENDAPAVQVATVHRSKGLEYEIVFCPFLWEARPIDRPPVTAHVETERLVFDCGSAQLEGHMALAEAERLAEDLRLTYVALTRARERCYVVWGDVPGKDGPSASALGYLLRPASPEGASESEPGVFDAGSPAEWSARALATVKSSREVRRRALEDFVSHHAEVMEVRFAEEMTKTPANLFLVDSGEALQPRTFTATPPTAWTLESFSSLSRGSTDPANEQPDHGDPEIPEALQRPAVVHLEGAPDAGASGLATFARGRRAGTCLHHVLEQCDFSNLNDPEIDSRIAETLRRHGLDQVSAHPHAARAASAGEPSGHGPAYDPAAVVSQLVRQLVSAPLPGEDFTLGHVPRTDCLIEWKFTAALADLAPRRLADVFATHARGAVGTDYSPRLKRLSAATVRGYLTGFVDLIFTHGERWFVVDWKSNYLGPDLASYGQEGLWSAMCHHHYVLQYHLYLFALHRFLRQRLPDYDYDRHIAGAYYVFLRGLGTPQDPANGWYLDRPPRELMDALEDLIDGRTAA